MPRPAPPYQFIAIARTIARGFTEQAIGHPDGEALTMQMPTKMAMKQSAGVIRATAFLHARFLVSSLSPCAEPSQHSGPVWAG